MMEEAIEGIKRGHLYDALIKNGNKKVDKPICNMSKFTMTDKYVILWSNCLRAHQSIKYHLL